MRILVVTETDACCGPMAAAFLRDYSVANEVVSVGRNPAETVDSMVVALMKECLVDLSGYQPRDVKEIDVSHFDAIYECPDMPVPDSLESGRLLRDMVKNEAYLFLRRV